DLEPERLQAVPCPLQLGRYLDWGEAGRQVGWAGDDDQRSADLSPGAGPDAAVVAAVQETREDQQLVGQERGVWVGWVAQGLPAKIVELRRARPDRQAQPDQPAVALGLRATGVQALTGRFTAEQAIGQAAAILGRIERLRG